MEEKLQEAFEGLCIKPEAPEELKMRTYPVGSAKVLELPGMGEDWRAEFWYGCIEACREEGKGAAFKMAWKDPAFLMKVVGASLSTATGAAGAAGGAGCVIAGIALTATGILAPVGNSSYCWWGRWWVVGGGGNSWRCYCYQWCH